MSSSPQPSIHFDPKTMKPQNWSIPESIVYYMATNPSSFEVYEKLRETCKYFYFTNPIIVVASLKYCKKREEDDSDSDDEDMNVEDDSGASNVSDISDNDDDSDDNMDESEGHASYISDDEEMEDGDDANVDVIQDINNGDVVAKVDDDGKKLTVCLECDCEENGCCMEIDLKTCKSKIWVTSDLDIDAFHEIRSDIMPKLASFEFDRPGFNSSQISFDDLAVFCQSATVVSLIDVKATHDDGKVVFVEEILDCIPKLYTFIYSFPDDASSISPKTAVSMFKNPNFKHAILTSIPEAFDVESFCGSINKKRKFAFMMIFPNDISDPYKVRLDTFVDTVIKEYLKFGLFITYPGQDMEKHMILRARYLQVM